MKHITCVHVCMCAKKMCQDDVKAGSFPPFGNEVKGSFHLRVAASAQLNRLACQFGRLSGLELWPLERWPQREHICSGVNGEKEPRPAAVRAKRRLKSLQRVVFAPACRPLVIVKSF